MTNFVRNQKEKGAVPGGRAPVVKTAHWPEHRSRPLECQPPSHIPLVFRVLVSELGLKPLFFDGYRSVDNEKVEKEATEVIERRSKKQEPTDDERLSQVAGVASDTVPPIGDQLFSSPSLVLANSLDGVRVVRALQHPAGQHNRDCRNRVDCGKLAAIGHEACQRDADDYIAECVMCEVEAHLVRKHRCHDAPPFRLGTITAKAMQAPVMAKIDDRKPNRSAPPRELCPSSKSAPVTAGHAIRQMKKVLRSFFIGRLLSIQLGTCNRTIAARLFCRYHSIISACRQGQPKTPFLAFLVS